MLRGVLAQVAGFRVNLLASRIVCADEKFNPSTLVVSTAFLTKAKDDSRLATQMKRSDFVF